MKDKGFAPLIAIIIAAAIALAVGGYFFTQKGFSLPGQKQRNDFGCWPSFCSVIPNPQGKKQCEDWKAGKGVQWPECSTFSDYPNCKKLCESEKQGAASGSGQKQAFNDLPSLIKADFASDVSIEDKTTIIQGISAMDFYLQKWFGKSINKPAGLRVAANSSADFSTGAEVIDENNTKVIVVHTKSELWNQQIALNKQIGGEWRSGAVAHEFVHVYQAQNGCGSQAQEHLKWFLEGEAVLLSQKAMQEAGFTPSFGVGQMNASMAKKAKASLKSFETGQGISSDPLSAYPLFAIAVDYLIKDKKITVLDDLCTNMSKGQTVPAAFQNSFGISLDKFYSDFETYRQKL